MCVPPAEDLDTPLLIVFFNTELIIYGRYAHVVAKKVSKESKQINYMWMVWYRHAMSTRIASADSSSENTPSMARLEFLLPNVLRKTFSFLCICAMLSIVSMKWREESLRINAMDVERHNFVIFFRF